MIVLARQKIARGRVSSYGIIVRKVLWRQRRDSWLINWSDLLFHFTHLP